jgi:hypothetical protein
MVTRRCGKGCGKCWRWPRPVPRAWPLCARICGVNSARERHGRRPGRPASRLAYVARAVAGLVRTAGIVRREHIDRVEEAYALYRSPSITASPTGIEARAFRGIYSHPETRIHFIGVWDTVGHLGVPVLGPGWLKPIVRRLNHRWEFHDTQLSARVDGAFQALAIDERRAALVPTLWHQQGGAEAAGQELKQVWFTGVHSDIGGGYADTSLSDIALLWMADRAREYGLAFVPRAFSPDGPTEARMSPDGSIDFKVAPNPMASPHSSWTKFYRLAKPVDRPIGKAAGGREYLATSAKERYDGGLGYRPPELVKYLADPENVHLEPVPESLTRSTGLPR